MFLFIEQVIGAAILFFECLAGFEHHFMHSLHTALTCRIAR